MKISYELDIQDHVKFCEYQTDKLMKIIKKNNNNGKLSKKNQVITIIFSFIVIFFFNFKKYGFGETIFISLIYISLIILFFGLLFLFIYGFLYLINKLVIQTIYKIIVKFFREKSIKNIVNKPENVGKFIGKLDIEFKEDFLVFSFNGDESKILYKNLLLEENEETLYLFKTSMSAYLIPKSKINYKGDKEKLYNFIRGKIVNNAENNK